MARSILIALAVASTIGCRLGGEDVGLQWEQSFSFSESRSTSAFEIAAPDPQTHTFEVRVEQPLTAAVGLTIRTWNDHTFHVFDSTAKRTSACERRWRRRICVARFPTLEAQRAGPWRVVVVKLSGAPAYVNVEVKFTPLST